MTSIERKVALLFFLLYGFGLKFMQDFNLPFANFISKFQFFQIIGLFLLILSLKNSSKIVLKFKIDRRLSIVLIFVFIATIFCAGYLSVFDADVPFSISNRFYVQISWLFAQIVIGYYSAELIISYHDLAYKYLFYGTIVCIIGVLYQVFFLGEYSGRLSGINGEPKHLSLYLVPFILCIWFTVKGDYKIFILQCILVALFLGTGSSTGFLALGVGFIVSTLVYKNKINDLFSPLILALLFLYLVISNQALYDVFIQRILSYSQGDYAKYIQTAIALPFIGEITVEGNDAPAIRLLLDNPYLALFGVGYGFDTVFSYPYLLLFDSGFLTSDYEGYITPNNAIVNNLLNIGFIPLAIMTYSVLFSFGTIRIMNNKVQHFLYLFFIIHFFINLLVYRTGFSLVISYIVIVIINYHYGENESLLILPE